MLFHKRCVWSIIPVPVYRARRPFPANITWSRTPASPIKWRRSAPSSPYTCWLMFFNELLYELYCFVVFVWVCSGLYHISGCSSSHFYYSVWYIDVSLLWFALQADLGQSLCLRTAFSYVCRCVCVHIHVHDMFVCMRVGGICAQRFAYICYVRWKEFFMVVEKGP